MLCIIFELMEQSKRIYKRTGRLFSYRDPKAGTPVIDESDVAAQVPARAASRGSLGLAQVPELGHAPQMGRLHRAHGLDGGVGE